MARLIVLGATGNLGKHVVTQALSQGHRVTVAVRSPSKLPAEWRDKVVVSQIDLAAASVEQLAATISEHDVLINTAGAVAGGDGFVSLIDRIVSGVEAIPSDARPVCWFLAGAAMLDFGDSGRRGVGLPVVRKTYWPHLKNVERLQKSALNWRVLCPGPMVEGPAMGLDRLRISIDRLPVKIPFASLLPGILLVPLFAYRVPEMIVPYADAAALMVSNLTPDGAMAKRRVGIALPDGMRGSKKTWTASAPP